MRRQIPWVLAAGAVVLASAAAARAETPPPDVGLKTEETRFDVYADNQKVGRMSIRVMSVRDVAIIDQDFTAPYRGKEAGFEAQVVYSGADVPRPQRGKATTRYAGLKLMDATLLFSGTAEGSETQPSAATAQATGYADKDNRLLAKPLEWKKELLVPAGRVLTYPALVLFAPRWLPKPGQIERIVYMEFPDDLAYPEVVNFKPDCTLARLPASDDGQVQYILKRVYAGGNAVTLATLTLDREGEVVEGRMSQYVLRPESSAPPAPKPGEAKPVPGKPGR